MLNKLFIITKKSYQKKKKKKIFLSWPGKQFNAFLEI